MIYLLCLAATLLGVGFHIMQAVRKLRGRYPEFGMSTIFSIFFKEEWDSMLVSFLVLLSYQMYLFVADFNELVKPPLWEKYGCDYILAFILGYAGQRLAYKYLKTAEGVLAKKADELKASE